MAALAARQHGVVATGQLHELGFGKAAISRLTDRGYLHRLYRAVYAVGHTSLTVHGRWLAAVLACGPHALLSHHAAAALHGLRAAPSRSALIDVTAPGRRTHPGIRAHVGPGAPGTILHSIPVTTLERTLIDYAEVTHPRFLNAALERLEREQRLRLDRLDAAIAQHPGRAGAARLRRAASAIRPDDRTRSELERAFLNLVAQAGLPAPQVNAFVDGVLVDCFWPHANLVVEVDHFGYHRSQRQFNEDRRRDAIHTLAGRRTLRPTGDWIDTDPAGLTATLSVLLDASV